MNTKKIFSYVAFFGGLALLVACFFIWKGDTANDVFYLNLTVASVAYCLFLGNLLLGNIVGVKEDSKVGSMGLKWMLLTGYPIVAIVAILLMSSLAFTVQLIVHLGLLLLLVFAFVAVFSVSSKAKTVAHEQQVAVDGVKKMKRAISSLQDAIVDNPDVPGTFRQKVDEIEQSLRYISPSDSADAAECEASFVETAMEVKIGLSDIAMNRERIEVGLAKLDRLANKRKNTYSN